VTAIGIVGGGQLAWMLADAASRLGVALHVQAPDADDPAVERAASLVLAPVDDVAATRVLAERCDAISFENEWIPIDALEVLAEEGVQFIPGLHSLHPLVSKRSQRELLNQLFLPAPRWCPLEAVLPPLMPEPSTTQGLSSPDSASLSAALPDPNQPASSGPRLPEGFQFPLMAKACTGGYDGKGTRPLRNQEELEALLAEVEIGSWILEDMVAFQQELALVACRDRAGNVACFPLVQTHQHHQVCDWVLFPAPVDHGVEALARNVAASVLTALDYVGVLSIEFFYGPCGLQVNELAPRTHNSGHFTIEACYSSQFEQQVRIVSGLPLASVEPRIAGAVMVNLLGFEDSGCDYQALRQRLEALPSATLHWYGKRQVHPGRKLGHLTLVLESSTLEERAVELERRLAEVRAIWPLQQGSERPECA
jgi:5-(carboxyamino)imidazole ribonucleotide synthase